MKCRIYVGTIFFSAIFCNAICFSAELTSDSPGAMLEQLLSQRFNANEPGVAIAVIQGDQTVVTRAIGLASLEHSIPISRSTVFDSASLAKSVTAYSVVKLANEGLLSLDDPIRKHLPELLPACQPISIRHLLHHSSGLRDWTMLLGISGWRDNDMWTTADAWRVLLRQQKLNFPPGEQYLYSNSGYVVLAMLVERVTDKTIHEWTREYLFLPLEMNTAQIRQDVNEIIPNMASSYGAIPEGGYRRFGDSTAVVGSSSLYMTIDDLAAWAKYWLMIRDSDAKLYTQLTEQGVLNDGKQSKYAMGIVAEPLGGVSTLNHGGAWLGYRSSMVIFPTLGTAVVVLSNRSDVDAEELAIEVAALYVEEVQVEDHSDLLGRTESLVTLSPEQASDFVGNYFCRPWMSEYRVTWAEGSLWIQRSKGPARKLRAINQTRFREDIAGHEVVFDSKNGALDYNNKAHGERFLRHSPTQDELAGLTGTYWSPEVLTPFTLVLDAQGRLILQHPRFEQPFLLDAITEDLYRLQQKYAGIYILRDNEGKVVGARFQSNRVRDLQYEKLSEGHLP